MSREHRYLDYMSRARYDRENGSLSEPHFPRVMASTIESIIRRIYYTGRNAQRFLASRLGKPRMPGVYILGPAILTWYADLHGAEVELYATAQITVQTLPDNVLLEIFKYHRLASLRSGPWKWYRLAQVCRRWRFIVYTHPRLLDLPIILTNTSPIWETPDFLPADIPVILWYRDSLSDKDADDIFNTLKNPAGICEIDIDMTRFLLEKCASLLEESFPALEYLRLGSQDSTRWEPLVISDNFMGNSAPRLRVICLQNTHFPMLPRLLSTSQNLVSLQLEHIPGKHIFTTQELAVGLSSTPQLKFLKIGIHGDVIPCPFIQIASHIRVILPSLLEFKYMGQGSYLNDLASRIDTPIIEQIGATFVSDGWGCDTYELCRLFARGEELRSSRRRTTHIRFFGESVTFIHHFTRSTSSPGSFQVRFVDRGWFHDHVILVSQICLNFQSLGIMHKLTWVEIEGFPSRSRRVLDADSWLTLLRTLSGVKRLYVIGTVVSNVMFTLAEVSVEGTRKILPALRDLHLPDVPTSRWSENIGIPGDIKRFVAARKLCRLPISVHYEGYNGMTAAWASELR